MASGDEINAYKANTVFGGEEIFDEGDHEPSKDTIR